jgi:uncharacterized membrane protein YqgA involved in biofilm formation
MIETRVLRLVALILVLCLSRNVTGTIINVLLILAGGAIGLTTRQISPSSQKALRNLLGVFTVYVGLSMAWGGVNGHFLAVLKQITIAMLALMFGNLSGKLIGLQRALNHLGQYARRQFDQSQGGQGKVAEGFITCTILFCVGPMAILGSLQDGLLHSPKTLIIKGCMDGLATMAFVKTFGPTVMLAAIPVLAYQGSLTLLSRFLEPVFRDQALLDSVGAVGGLLVCFVALVIFEFRKIRLADYLPSLVYAPLLTWWWR